VFCGGFLRRPPRAPPPPLRLAPVLPAPGKCAAAPPVIRWPLSSTIATAASAWSGPTTSCESTSSLPASRSCWFTSAPAAASFPPVGPAPAPFMDESSIEARLPAAVDSSTATLSRGRGRVNGAATSNQANHLAARPTAVSACKPSFAFQFRAFALVPAAGPAGPAGVCSGEGYGAPRC
jgi:hypothetical protein